MGSTSSDKCAGQKSQSGLRKLAVHIGCMVGACCSLPQTSNLESTPRSTLGCRLPLLATQVCLHCQDPPSDATKAATASMSSSSSRGMLE